MSSEPDPAALRRPVALTMGDACGIGPEIVAELFRRPESAGCVVPGHTEMLQALAARGGVPPPVRMMLANDELRTVLVTIHLSLRRAIDALSFDTVLETIRIAHRSAVRFGLSAPRIAVAGLNPHAGE